MIKKTAQIIGDFSGGQDTKTPIISMGLEKSPNMRNWHCAGLGKRLIKRGGFAKVNSSAVESDGLDACYPPGYQTYDYALRDTAALTEIAQGFKANTTDVCTKVKLWLKKNGSPTGNINIEIQTNNGGVPSGTAVTNGTSANVDVSTLGTSYGWITFTFSANPSLTSGTTYHIVLQGDYTISATNYVHWGVDDYDVVFADGAMSNNDGTTWVADSNYNACFEVYITGGDKGNDGFALWDFSSRNMMLGIWGTTLYRMDKNSSGTPDGTWDSVAGGSAWDTYTKFISHFDGADGATSATDEIGNTITFVGTAQLDTAQKKFGTASLLLDGNSDYVTLADSDDWNFGSGDFTIDCWVRFTSVVGAGFLEQVASTADRWSFHMVDANTIRFIVTDANVETIDVSKSWTPATGTWYHIELVRSGNDFMIFIDGSQIGTTTTDTSSVPDIASSLNIGEYNIGGTYLNGWIDELRISKGIARHTADFTPETAAYSATALPITSSRFWTFADWQSGRALINTDIGLWTYTGSGDASSVSAAPVGKFLTIWKGYALVFGIRGSPNNGQWSTLTDYTTWPAANTFANAFDTNDGDVITGVRTLKGKLYVFKRYSVFRISYLGSNPTFKVDQVLGVGCPSHFTIKEVDIGGEVGSVLVFPTTDKKLAIFDGYNVRIVNDTLTEETNDLFATADDQPISFSDMDYNYIDKFHATVKTDSFEYILYCVLSGDTTVKYAFAFDYRTGGVYPYDGQIFASNVFMMSTNKQKILYCAGYTGYIWQQESGDDDDGTAINAYWVSGKIRANSVGLLSKLLLLGINFKKITSASILNMGLQYRLDWNVSWNTSQNFNYDHNDKLSFGKTAMFDVGTIENMFQIKITENSKNPAPTLYSLELYGKSRGIEISDKATA